MNIKIKIAEVLAGLAWTVQHEQGARDLEITSDPWSKTHFIKIPTAGPEWRDIEYLHELAHATLAERHHLLATAYYIRATPAAYCAPLVDPFRTASDWYADDLLMQWAPDQEREEILEHAGYALNNISRDRTMIYGGGLFLAQAVRYCKQSLNDVPRRYRPVAKVLLSFDPSRPTVSDKQNLINRLATLTCPYRVHPAKEDGMDVWQIRKEKS